MASTTIVPVRSPSCASTLACVGVCGYLVGLALPLARPFDLPLVFLVLLALIGVGLVMLARIIRSRRDDVRSFGARAAFIAFLAAALFELSLVRVWVTIVLFILFGLLTTIGRSEKRGSVCATH